MHFLFVPPIMFCIQIRRHLRLWAVNRGCYWLAKRESCDEVIKDERIKTKTATDSGEFGGFFEGLQLDGIADDEFGEVGFGEVGFDVKADGEAA